MWDKVCSRLRFENIQDWEVFELVLDKNNYVEEQWQSISQ